MNKGSVVIGALACFSVGVIGILEVTAAPAGPRNVNRAANLTNNNPKGAGSEGGVAGGEPDVTVSRLGLNSSGSGDDMHYYGVSNVGGVNVRAFSMASTSCNVGSATAEWVSGGRNPVIAQNLYRYNDGKFEQIGMSWLKHSFCAVSENTCGACQGTPCSSLGIGCADTYWATLNGDNSDLGPRWNVNPQGFGAGGVHNDVYNLPTGPSTIRGRLQVKDTDLLPNSQYVAEIHYLTHDEQYSNRYNNASHRFVNVTTSSMTGVGVGQGSVFQGQPGINAWKAIDSNVVLSFGLDSSPAGRFDIGCRVYDNGNGTWTYEYAVHNMNSHRGAQAFSIPIPDGVNVTDIGFHDVDYHSGDGVGYVTRDGTDWTATVAGGKIEWATQLYADNQNANALMWGTLYNFRFTADIGPVTGDAGVALFRPAGAGEPTRIQIATRVPDAPELICLGDMVDSGTFNPPADGQIDGADLAYLLGEWGPNPGSLADLVDSNTFLPPADGVVDGADLAYLLGGWGSCN